MSNQISISTLFELYYFIHKPGGVGTADPNSIFNDQRIESSRRKDLL